MSYHYILGVLMFSAMANRFRMYKLGAVDQFVMMYGGMRGGVAFALVLLIDDSTVPHARMFVTTTIAMIYWTSFVQGITIKPLVKILGLKTAEEKNPTMNERINRRTMDHLVGGIESVLGHQSGRFHRNLYNHIDHKYIKPWLLRDTKARDQKILETFEKKIQDDALKFIQQNVCSFKLSENPSKEIAKTNKICDQTNNNSIVRPNPVNPETIPSLNSPVEIRIDQFDTPLPSRRHSQLRRLSTAKADVDIGNLLSINLVEPTNRSRRLSERHWVQDVTSVKELDVSEPTDHPTFTRHQLKEAARKLSTNSRI